MFRHKKLVATQNTLTKNPHLICGFEMRSYYWALHDIHHCPISLTMTLVDIPEAVYTMAFGGVATGSMNA